MQATSTFQKLQKELQSIEEYGTSYFGSIPPKDPIALKQVISQLKNYALQTAIYAQRLEDSLEDLAFAKVDLKEVEALVTQQLKDFFPQTQ